MDIEFKCRHCNQSLTVDDDGAGTEIECPSCGGTITIPTADPTPDAEPARDPMHVQPRIINAMATSAAAREGEKHFAVPQHDKPAEALIEKPLKPLDAAAKEGITIRVKCIRHFDCVEVGKDHFDEVVTKFINNVGEPHIIKIETFNYAHRDLETRDWVTDYGVFILYRG